MVGKQEVTYVFLHAEPPGRWLALSVLAEPNHSRALGNDLRHASDEKTPLLAPLGHKITGPKSSASREIKRCVYT